MSERLAEVGHHIDTVRQLGAVVNAMRGIAAARAQQSRAVLPAIREYAEIAARAIGQALLLDEAPARPTSMDDSSAALIVFGAEQGFAGAFADQVLESAAAEFRGRYVILVGTRSAALARERGLSVDRTFAEPLHVPAITRVAALLVEAVYDHLRESGASQVRMVFPTWAAGGGLKVTHRNLLPLDNSHFPKAADVVPRPMIQLPLPELLERLGQEYVFAQICEAAAESFAAENQARVATMAAASSNIDAKLTALRSQERLTRQQDITAEVIELAASARSH